MKKNSQQPNKIVFVCTGNICRSPMAEYLLRHHLRGNDRWGTASAGLFAIPGQPASLAAVEVLREQGIDLMPHRSRILCKELVDEAAWVVVMTYRHTVEVRARFPSIGGKLRLINEFRDTRPVRDISDPIGCSSAVYRIIRDEINSALLDLILFLQKGQK